MRCPYCDELFSQQLLDRYGIIAEARGFLLVCSGCAAVLISEHGDFRGLTDEEMWTLQANEYWERISAERDETIKRLKCEHHPKG